VVVRVWAKRGAPGGVVPSVGPLVRCGKELLIARSEHGKAARRRRRRGRSETGLESTRSSAPPCVARFASPLPYGACTGVLGKNERERAGSSGGTILRFAQPSRRPYRRNPPREPRAVTRLPRTTVSSRKSEQLTTALTLARARPAPALRRYAEHQDAWRLSKLKRATRSSQTF
jgi:hypothetical protein